MTISKERQESNDMRKMARVEIGEAGEPNLIEMVWLLNEFYHEKQLSILLGADGDTIRGWRHLRSVPTAANAKKVEKLFWETFAHPE